MPRKKTAAAPETSPPGAWLPSTPEMDHVKAVAEFERADAEYKQLEEFVSGGGFVADLFANCGGDVEKAKREWNDLWDRLRTLLEDRNAKRKSAADALRQVVQLAPSQWRGPEGQPTLTQCGPFQVTSVTRRGFDAETLFSLAKDHGVLERMMELKTLDKDGKEVPLVRQSWTVDFAGICSWLKANRLDDVLNGAYDERESTPQVRGPKELAFLGDKKGD